MQQASTNHAPPDYFPHPFQLHGRIGRLRFMAYAFLATLPWGLPSLAAAFDIIYAFPQWLHWPALLVSAALMGMVVVRRLADLALPWTRALLILVPLACALLGGIWLLLGLPMAGVAYVMLALAPARARARTYGPPPCANHALLLVPIALWAAYPAAIVYGFHVGKLAIRLTT